MCRGLGFIRSDSTDVHDIRFGKLVPCNCNGEYRTRSQSRLSDMSGQKLDEMEVTFSDIIDRGADTRRMLSIARGFVANPKGFLTFWGTWGNGKTLILQAVVNELRKAGMTTAYVTFKDLIDWVSAGFDDADSQGTERQRFQFVKQAQVLAIDEIDKTRMTDYRAEFRTAFFDWRYRSAIAGDAHTLFVMNENPERLPPDIYDRLRQFEIVHNGDQSMRPALRIPF